DRMPHARLLKRGCDHPDFAVGAGESTGDLFGDREPGGRDPVVVGNQDAHVCPLVLDAVLGEGPRGVHPRPDGAWPGNAGVVVCLGALRFWRVSKPSGSPNFSCSAEYDPMGACCTAKRPAYLIWMP